MKHLTYKDDQTIELVADPSKTSIVEALTEARQLAIDNPGVEFNLTYMTFYMMIEPETDIDSMVDEFEEWLNNFTRMEANDENFE
jgi:hypothetical protein